MDFHLKQWRNQLHESEQLQQQQEQPSAKIPKLLLDPQHHLNQSPPATSAALPLFLPEPNDNTKISFLSAFPDSTTSPPATTRFSKMGSYFSLAQFQELELQSLIYRYMLAGAAIPPELLQPIKKSILHPPSYFLHHPLQHYSFCQTPLLQTGYWGRGSMDPEPGRCRRTDGKKWRCSRDVVVGQKYCERHVHRGRNRSRKPVETPTNNPASSIAVGGGSLAGSCATAHIAAASPSLTAAMAANGSSFTVLPGQSPPIDLFHLGNNSSESKAENKVLRHFFDDWPRSVQDSENGGNRAGQMNSSTSLSISMPGNGNSSSDVSLKLSTGVGEVEESGARGNNSTREQPQVNWGGGWGANQMSSMGGPLAEALRSSTSTSSPTSVLHHQMPRHSASEPSYIST